MQEAFDFTEEQYAYFGAYPGAAGFIKNEARWLAYVKDSLIETSISKDILMLTRVDKPALLKQLFELGCAYSTQELSFNKIMGQLQNAGNTTTLSHYVNLRVHKLSYAIHRQNFKYTTMHFTVCIAKQILQTQLKILHIGVDGLKVLLEHIY
jgi:hypothetical protein